MAKSRKEFRSRDRSQPLVSPKQAEAVASALSPSKPSRFSQVVFRESVEAVVIAFVLAFLVRTFEAEAFVIPTGSMATTLMGQHKDVVCPECGYPFQVGASDPVSSEQGEASPGQIVCFGTCPMCRHTMPVEHERSYSGDRILVGKLGFRLDRPERWDVTVFKYPNGAATNFIKRMVGLPDETLRISHGDLFIRKKGGQEFSIARKPPEKMRHMLRVVDDTDYQPENLLAVGWPARWSADSDSQGWVVADDGKSFANDGSTVGQRWLRYRNYVADYDVWSRVNQGMSLVGFSPKPQLISDFCAYNSGSNKEGFHRGEGLHWVGDLAVSCTLETRKAQGEVLFELVEGGRRMQCRIDTATGQAKLSISGTTFERTGKTAITKPGSYEVLFSNVDDQLRLLIDGKLVVFDGTTAYEPLGNTIPDEDDLLPVGIATLGADVKISHVKVLRDVYYVACNDPRQPMCDFIMDDGRNRPWDEYGAFTQPSLWPEAFAKGSMREVTFSLDKDQFFMLGDNSPQSKDARLWGGRESYVHRDLLIGKALFIYWPHSWDKVSVGKTDIPFPFFPNFKEMEFVR